MSRSLTTASLVLAGVLAARTARADLDPPTGNGVTGGVAVGAVGGGDDGTSGFVDGELAWTYYPSEVAGGVLAPGLVADAGFEVGGSDRGRVTLAAKLGVLYALGVEAGYAVRPGADDVLHGPTARLRLNLPVGELTYVSVSYRVIALVDHDAVSEVGLSLKFLLWGDSAKLEGVFNR